MADSQRTRIQNLLVSTAKAGTFNPVSYTAGVASIDDESSIAPAAAIANEINASFEDDRAQMDDVNRKRKSWQFELHLAWNQEVDLSRFEKSITVPVLRLLPDTDNGFGNVFLRLQSAKYEHPVQQQSSMGSKAKMIFNADEGAFY